MMTADNYDGAKYDYTLVYYCTSLFPVADLSPLEEFAHAHSDVVYEFQTFFTSNDDKSFVVCASMSFDVCKVANQEELADKETMLVNEIRKLGKAISVDTLMSKIVKIKVMY